MAIARRGEDSVSGSGSGTPRVAFPVPTSSLVTCEGPVNIIWLWAGAFGPSDALFDLSLTNTGLSQHPSQSGSASATTSTAMNPPAPAAPITIVIARSQNVTATNHFFAWQQVNLPSGYYVVNGTSVDSSSDVTFIPSAPFFILPGADTSCISINPPLPPSQSQSQSHSAPGTQAPPTTSTTTATITSSNHLESASSSAALAPTDIPLNTEPRSTTIDHRAKIIAGSVAGVVGLLLLLIAFYVFLYLRRRPPTTYVVDPETIPGSRHLQRISSRPPPIKVPMPSDDESTTSVYLTVPTPALRFPSSGGERGADSFTTQRSALQARWGWAVPLTPMFNLLSARRSSMLGAVDAPASANATTAQFAIARGERSPLPSASFMGRSRMTSLSGLDLSALGEHERERLHSLSEFRWVDGFPATREQGSTVTVERLEPLDEKDTPSSTPTKK